jgi:hypothetical protein
LAVGISLAVAFMAVVTVTAAREMEQKLLALQERFRTERDETRRMAIRAAYEKLHARWIVARQEQLSLRGVA